MARMRWPLSVAPHSTVEELFLLKQLAQAVGTPNVDFRLRQSDFSAPVNGTPWLGTAIAESVERRRARL